MSEDWRNELVTKGAVVDALTEIESHYEFEDGHDHLMRWAKTKIFALPSEQPYTTTDTTADTISRQAAKLKVARVIWEDGDSCYDFQDKCVDSLDDVSSAQPQRMKGRWVRKESDMSWWYECCECGESPLYDPYENEVLTPFCPWCGARMMEVEHETD